MNRDKARVRAAGLLSDTFVSYRVKTAKLRRQALMVSRTPPGTRKCMLGDKVASEITPKVLAPLRTGYSPSTIKV